MVVGLGVSTVSSVVGLMPFVEVRKFLLWLVVHFLGTSLGSFPNSIRSTGSLEHMRTFASSGALGSWLLSG